MGFDFKSTSGKEFRFNSSTWAKVLNLAMFFGWKPKMTYLQQHSIRIPDGLGISDEEYIRDTQLKWDGSYTCNEGQLVTENDAFNLAFCLMKATKILSDKNVCEFLHLMNNFDSKNKIFIEIYSWSGERENNILKDFIRFCIGGEFDIR